MKALLFTAQCNVHIFVADLRRDHGLELRIKKEKQSIHMPHVHVDVQCACFIYAQINFFLKSFMISIECALHCTSFLLQGVAFRTCLLHQLFITSHFEKSDYAYA